MYVNILNIIEQTSWTQNFHWPIPNSLQVFCSCEEKTLDLRVPQRNGMAWLVCGQGMNLTMWYLAGAMTWKSNKHGGLSIKPIGLISSQPADIKGIFMVSGDRLGYIWCILTGYNQRIIRVWGQNWPSVTHVLWKLTPWLPWLTRNALAALVTTFPPDLIDVEMYMFMLSGILYRRKKVLVWTQRANYCDLNGKHGPLHLGSEFIQKKMVS
jgi:hypothetical protein